MALFQSPPRTQAEVDANRPLDLAPEEVQGLSEAEWYAKAYRGDVPQLTVRAVLMGCVLGFFLSFTNLYIGLKTGWFLGVALTACILSFSIWTSLLRIGLAKTPMTILETNCMQSTASSAGYATGNSLISAMPALLMLSVSDANPKGTQLPWPLTAAWVFFLAVFGVCIAIPLKRNMINQEKLRFPSGTAAAVTLQSLYSHGEAALQKARALYIAGVVGLLLPPIKDLGLVVDRAAHTRSGLVPGAFSIFDWIPLPAFMRGSAAKPFVFSDYTVKLDNSLVLVAAGSIVGIRIAAWMMVGSLVLVFVITPIAVSAEWINAAGKLVHAAKSPGTAWKEIGLWLGAPLLVSSGLVSFAFQWRTIARAFSGIFAPKKAAKSSAEKHPAESSTDPAAVAAAVEPPMSWFAAGATFSGVGIVFIASHYFEIPVMFGVLALVLTFALALVACRATGETDITPGGAMGKIMQLTYGVLIPQSVTANLMTASISSNAGLASADLLNDLKSGYLLGANPRRQFIAQASGICVGTAASVLGYFLLVPDASALSGESPKFAAPSAQQWRAVAELFRSGMQNLHPMARTLIVVGIAIGSLLAILEGFVPKEKRKHVPSATGIGLGLVLPFFYPLAMFLGAALAWLGEKYAKEKTEKYGIAIAAGLIAGESIMGVIVAGVDNLVLPRIFGF